MVKRYISKYKTFGYMRGKYEGSGPIKAKIRINDQFFIYLSFILFLLETGN